MTSPSNGSNDVNYNEIKENLLQKISLYKERKWIDEQEEERFRNFLLSNDKSENSKDSSNNNSTSSIAKAIKGVHKWLRAIEKAHRKDGSRRSSHNKKNNIISNSSKKKNDHDINDNNNAPLSSEDEKMRKKLIATVKVFRQRQWIDETEEEGFHSLLSLNDKDNYVPLKKSLETSERRLIAIKKERLKQESIARKETKRKMKKSSTKSFSSSSASTSVSVSNSFTFNDNFDSKVYTAEEVVDTLSHGVTEQLFTEMCVFARMSFLQPTSCLHCAFHQSRQKLQQKSNSSTDEKENKGFKSCENFVVWRRDATIPMHPNKLDDNLLIVSCSTAKAWMQGEIVHGLKWDKHTKKIVNTSKQ